MRIDSVYSFLKSIPHNQSGDGSQLMVRCPFCGDSRKNADSKHLSIKIDVEENEPMLYKCFQPDYRCGAKGYVTTEVLQRLGCTDVQTLLDLAKHNSKVTKHGDRFRYKKHKPYVLSNVNTKLNQEKAEYINWRLGTDMTPDEMKAFKIQLSLYDFLRINNIHKLAFSENKCDMIDACTIGFVSAYSDYLICRDITKDQVMKLRYTMYRASGQPDINDTKIYIIPTDIDLLDPRSANINIAEGTFSILGAYLHCEEGKDRRNNIFAANCGTGYKKTIDHITKQYGFLKVRIHIWSDSEVPVKTYEKLYEMIKDRLDIRSFQIHYNKKGDDFGHAAKDIKVNTVTLK